MDLIIKNGNIITASDTYKADIGIKDGKIISISKSLEEKSAKEVIFAEDKYIFPGIIDAHVHFELPMAGTVSSDDFENGTKAAACGGVTTVIDYATQEGEESLVDTLNKRIETAKDKVCIDYGLHVGITNWGKKTIEELDEIFSMGVMSFKMFMAYRSRGLMSEDWQLFNALEETKKRGGVISVHAESDSVLEFLVERYHKAREKHGVYSHVLSRPDVIEIDAIERAIKWAELSGGTLYIVHMTTGEGLLAVKRAKEKGVNVYAETCPQYLMLDDSVFQKEDGYLYTTCPQIKSLDNQKMLWQGVTNKDFDVIATDTCTFTKRQKDLWDGDFTKLPFGLPGVETLLPIIYTFGVGRNRITVNQMVALLSTNPAKIYGLYPEKGTIVIGSDADLTIFDPNKEVTIDYKNLQTNCDWSPYQGIQLKGYPELTISRGKIVAKEGKFLGEPGKGKFVKRKPVLDKI